MIKNLFKAAKSIYSIVACALILFSTIAYSAAPMPGMPNMSEVEMQKFMGELENTAKEIDNFVSSLPPAEQKEFNRAVQEVEQMINDMSEDELEQFIGGMFGAPGAEKPAKPTEPEVPVAEIKVEEKPKLTKKELSEQEKALDLLDTLIKRTESFLVKAQSMPELTGKTKQWAKKGRIRNWQADSNWSQVKTAIDRLVQKFHKMKDQDPKTKEYKFLKDFIEDKALYNNLSLLRSSLDKYEPTIEVSAFGIQKMSAKDKSALQQLIGSFTESLYVLKTPDALNKIIAKYEPRAKELAEEEKKVQERATQASKRGPRAKATVVGGTPEDEGGFYGGDYGYDDYDYNGGYGRGYDSDYQPSAYAGPSYTPSGGTPSSRKTGGARQAQPKANLVSKKDKTPEATKVTGKEKSSKGKRIKPQLTKEMMAAETYLDDITNLVNQVVTELSNTPLLGDKIKQNLTQVESDETIFNNVNAINSITRKAKKINDDYISRIKLKAKTPELKKAYKQRLEEILKEINVDKKTIKPKQKLDSLVKVLDTVEKDKDNMPVINQYVYFGGMAGIDEKSMQGVKDAIEKEEAGEELTDEQKDTVTKYKADFERMSKLPQTSLVDLRTSIKNILDVIQNFDKVESKKSAKKSNFKK